MDESNKPPAAHRADFGQVIDRPLFKQRVAGPEHLGVAGIEPVVGHGVEPFCR